jgi:hypothetical protein
MGKQCNLQPRFALYHYISLIQNDIFNKHAIFWGDGFIGSCISCRVSITLPESFCLAGSALMHRLPEFSRLRAMTGAAAV